MDGRSLGTLNLHRNRDETKEILDMNCTTVGLNDSLLRPITQQSTDRELRGPHHLRQILAGQVDCCRADRTARLHNEAQQKLCQPLRNTLIGKFMDSTAPGPASAILRSP